MEEKNILFKIKNIINNYPENVDSEFYLIEADKIDLKAMDSYPQKVIEVYSTCPRYKVLLQVKPDIERRKAVRIYPEGYPEEARIYLEPSGKINSKSTAIIKKTKEIIGGEKNELIIIRKIISWVSKNIIFDKNLAEKISAGTSNTNDALDVLKTLKGTCGEAVNLAIAFLRACKIPARYCEGYMVGGKHHAWLEVYFAKARWLPFDPQADSFRLVFSKNKYIKLFHGKDLADINVKIKDINIKVTPIDFFEIFQGGDQN